MRKDDELYLLKALQEAQTEFIEHIEASREIKDLFDASSKESRLLKECLLAAFSRGFEEGMSVILEIDREELPELDLEDEPGIH